MQKLTLKLMVILAIGFPLICKGQDHTVNMLSFQWGTGSIVQQDLIFSPFAHSDISPLNFGFIYQRDKHLYQEVSLGYSGYNPMLTHSYRYTETDETRITYPHSFHFINMDYVLGGDLYSSSLKQFLLGALFSSHVQIMNYNFGRIGHFGYTTSIGLGLFSKYQYVLVNEQRIGFSIRLPLYFWMARSPYLVNDDEFIENTSSHDALITFRDFLIDGRSATWNSLKQIDFRADYDRKLFRNLRIGIQYRLSWSNGENPRESVIFRNTFYVITKFGW